MQQKQIITLNKTEPVVCEYAGGCFKLNEQGVSFIGKEKDGNSMAPRWICSPLQVVAKTRDAKSGEWGSIT
jgi:hypothetical protein